MTYSEGGDVCIGFIECRCGRCITEKRAKIKAASRATNTRWIAYGGIVEEEFGGCWQTTLLGPTSKSPVPSIGTAGRELPWLGEWDHEPTVQEIDAVLPWDYRTICPACGSECCDDEAHTEANWPPSRGGAE